jgi:hypothetical protein
VAERGEEPKALVDQRFEVASEPAGVNLSQSLTKEIRDPAELADRGVVQLGYGWNRDLTINGERAR